MLSETYKIVVLDNLKYGHKKAIDKSAIFYNGDINDTVILDTIFKKHRITTVMHFAAYTDVRESVQDPAKYYHNNVAAPMILLDAMRQHNCLNFIFSSNCATYGVLEYIPLDESHAQNPINAYGESKYMLEKIVKDYSKAYGINYAFLRYFNACGAREDCSIGEDHTPETHLIPVILKAIKGEIEAITVYGTDYDTPDGTCIRDYIHVVDLAKAHLKALEFLLSGKGSISCNLSTGRGVSIKEVIELSEAVTGKKVSVLWGSRREGGPAQLVANPSYALETLGWKAEYMELKDIINSAWNCHNGKYKGKYN